MRALMRGLLKIKVRPYYLFHCDPVTGAGHFRTSVWKGLEIIEGLRGHISGLGVPTYVVDGMHGAGKIPLMPNYLVSASENAVVLRNYEGLLFRYAPEDRADGKAEHYPSLGVSNLLSGNIGALVPEDTPRYTSPRSGRCRSRRSPTGLPILDGPHFDGVPLGGLHILSAAHQRAGPNGRPFQSQVTRTLVGSTERVANGQAFACPFAL